MTHALTVLDIFAVLVIVATTVVYTLKGFFRGLFGIAAVGAGFILAGLFYRWPAAFFQPYVKTDALAQLLGYLTIFWGIILLKSLALFVVYKVLKATRLRWFDKVLGTLFGFVMGWMIATVLFLSLTVFPLKTESVEHSWLAPYFLTSAEMFVLAVPDELKQRFNAEYQRITEYWNQHKG